MSQLFYIGNIILHAGRSDPPGFLKCDGAPLNVSEYGALFSQIGNRYGGIGMMFNLPTMVSPLPGANYYICVQGLYPA